LTEFWAALSAGLVTSAIIGLSAVAMSMQFGVTKHANFAHGELLTIAAYTAVEVRHLTSNIVVEALAGGIVAALAAWAINRFLIERYRKLANRLLMLLIVTAAISQAIQGALALGFGVDHVVLTTPTQVSHKIGPFTWNTLDMQILVVAVLAFAALHILLRYTTFGRAQRAVADDAVLARVVGINTSRIISLTWLVVGFIAGLAGVALASTIGSFNNQLGFNYLLVTFAAVIVGGIGKMYGALAGALIIGLVTEFSGFYLSSGYKQEIALLVLILVLFVRPNGLFTTLVGERA
jgi:branched-subunit amino acid ABC-type transport system permease component